MFAGEVGCVAKIVNPQKKSMPVLTRPHRLRLRPGLILALLLGIFCAATGGALALEPVAKSPQAGDLHLNSFSAVPESVLDGQPGKPVHMEAKLTEKGASLTYGLTWRVFKPIAGADGKLPLLASSVGGSTQFDLPPGEYFVNVAFGRAGATKKVVVAQSGDPGPQTFVLDAGGVVLNAVSGTDMRIPPDELTFNIYSSEVREDGERGMIMSDVKPGELVRLNAGTYHIVSNYGNVNATIRADIQIAAGKLVEATIQHRAAKITLKLVSQVGGEAIADTAWSILSPSGDSVSESVGAFPVVVLAEGKYTAVARHKDKIYQRDFTVTPGRNEDVEVLLQD
jgi:molybdopterin-binding protein